MITLFWLVLFIVGGIALLYRRTPLKNFALATAGALVLYTLFGDCGLFGKLLLWVALLGPQLAWMNDDLRKGQITSRALDFYRSVQPKMSATEQEALAAGTVWWEGDLFSGAPNWNKLLATPAAALTDAEQAFIDGPVNTLCDMVDEWEISHQRAEIPAEVWTYIKEQGFLGMIIPPEFGGLGFSPFAQSQILIRIGSASQTVSTVIAVPNSLGPGELLLKYGTDEQKECYLPALAKGKEIPCFGLTAPTAGSDATSIPDTGVVCEAELNGKKQLCLRLTFSKRYITLAPVATLIGLAFKLSDPDKLLGAPDKSDYGITCALIPADTPGVDVGKRHYPLGCAWPNGPIRGEDVLVPLDTIIGGASMAGKGWRMLVECLSVGRAVSLPAAGTGAALGGAVTAGAYARLRQQFGMPIAKFEGIADVLGGLGGRAYAIDAARQMTLAAIGQGEKPSVAGAIMKYHASELGRSAIQDAMDIHGGKAIMLGPKNYLYRAWQEAPISITVEGANILTRNMIIFGQGALRCHPWVLRELQAANLDDPKQRLDEFDTALNGHIGFVLSNIARAFALGLSDGRFETAPVNGPTRRYYQQFSRWAAVLAVCTDTAMATLGGQLKFRESLSARLGDLLSYLYIGSATLKRFEDTGRPAAELPMVQWASEWLLYELQQQCHQFIRNLSDGGWPQRLVGLKLRAWCLPLGLRYQGPSDTLTHQVAELLQQPGASRDRLGEILFSENNGRHAAGVLSHAFELVAACSDLEGRIAKASKSGLLVVADGQDKIDAAEQAEVVTAEEAQQLRDAQAALMDVIHVDEFETADLARSTD